MALQTRSRTGATMLAGGLILALCGCASTEVSTGPRLGGTTGTPVGTAPGSTAGRTTPGTGTGSTIRSTPDPTSASSPSTTVPPTGGPPGDRLAGRTFVLRSWPGSGARPPVAGEVATLRFDGDTLTMRGFCRTLTGPFTVDGTTLVSTLSGDPSPDPCDTSSIELDAMLSLVLNVRLTILLDGDTLTLTSGPLALGFTAQDVSGSSPRPLVGTTWIAHGLLDGEVVERLTPSTPGGTAGTTSIRFGADGTMAVQLPCNSGSGTYTIDPTEEAVLFGPLTTTRMACADEAAMGHESAILAVLTGEATYTIVGGSLTLKAGDIGLALSAEGS